MNLKPQLQKYFRLDDPLDAIHAQLQRDPTVAQAIECYPGLRLLRQDPWECLVSYLCSRNNSIGGIKRNVEEIAKLSCAKVWLGDDKRFLFPSPQHILNKGLTALTCLRLGMQERACSIYLMAEQVDRDPTLLEGMACSGAPTHEVVKRLDSYPGIGPKIASCVALMSLEKMDAFPVDRWIWRGLAKCDLPSMCPELEEKVKSIGEKIPGEKMSLSEAEQYKIAEWARRRFGRYAGYAGQYLFHSIEPHKDAARHKRGMS